MTGTQSSLPSPGDDDPVILDPGVQCLQMLFNAAACVLPAALALYVAARIIWPGSWE